MALITTALTAFGIIFAAELGDKTQLVALGFGARHRLKTVALGLLVGFAAVGALAAIVGGVLGAALPERPIAIVGGVLFLGFAAWTLWELRNAATHTDAESGSGHPGDSPRPGRSVVITIAFGIALAELGDKTQLTTATLAAQHNPVAVWIGSTLGTASAAMVGATLGKQLGDRLNPRWIALGSAVLFAVFGVVLLATA